MKQKRTALLISSIDSEKTHYNCNCRKCYSDPYSEGHACKDQTGFIRFCDDCEDDTDCPGLNLCTKCHNPLFPTDSGNHCRYCKVTPVKILNGTTSKNNHYKAYKREKNTR